MDTGMYCYNCEAKFWITYKDVSLDVRFCPFCRSEDIEEDESFTDDEDE